MRFVPNDGIPIRELQRLTRLTPKDMRTWLTRMGAWWGYVAVEPDPSGSRSKGPGAGWVVRPTTGGRKALEAWRPLTGVIEKRWQQRFGQDEIGHIRASLQLEAPDIRQAMEYAAWLANEKTIILPSSQT